MRRGWAYVVTGVLFAGICAWISYNDGLFVARLAGNHDTLAYFYPLLPDGLIVLCLLALAEAARAGAPRSRWAVAGLLLGIGLTLAMNTYAGVEHSPLDAVLDGMVPVVFFIAAEVVLWHVRRGRDGTTLLPSRPSDARTVPSTAFEAAKARMREADKRGFRYSNNEAETDFGLSRAQAAKARKQVTAELPAGASSPDTDSRAPGGNGRGAVLGVGHGTPAAQVVPAGAPPTPAGTLNGQAHGG